MKLDINTIIKYAYSELPDDEKEQIAELLYSDEYTLEYEVFQSIMNIGLRERMNIKQMQSWVEENNVSLLKSLEKVHKKKAPSFFEKVKQTEQQLIKWFDENILLNKPILQLARTRVAANERTANDAVKINIDDNYLNAELNFPATKAIKLIIEDTEGEKVLKTKLTEDTSINLATLNLHAGAYLWIANSTEIELQYGIFYIDEHLKPTQS